ADIAGKQHNRLLNLLDNTRVYHSIPLLCPYTMLYYRQHGCIIEYPPSAHHTMLCHTINSKLPNSTSPTCSPNWIDCVRASPSLNANAISSCWPAPRLLTPKPRPHAAAWRCCRKPPSSCRCRLISRPHLPMSRVWRSSI